VTRLSGPAREFDSHGAIQTDAPEASQV